MNRLRILIGCGSALVAATAVFSGCSSATRDSWTKMLREPAVGEAKKEGKPKFEVSGRPLGESDEQTIPTGQFAGRISELLSSDQLTFAGRWVERFPEVAQELLRADDDKIAKSAVRQFVASAHDRHTISPRSKSHWSEIATPAEKNSPRGKYREARSHFRKFFTEGHVEIALTQELVQIANSTGSPLLAIDAWHQVGMAQLLNDQPKEAAQAFEQAVRQASTISDYQTAYLLVSLSDAQRRLGDIPAANRSWRNAVNTAEKTLTQERPVRDPLLWERLSYFRPIEESWPLPVLESLNRVSPLHDYATSPLAAGASDTPVVAPAGESVLWHAIGSWYLDRNQGQTSLVAFKRAESSSTSEYSKQFLRIKQARALAHLEQLGPATAILSAIASDKKSPIAPQAYALLGSLRLRGGQLQQGLAFLRKGIDQNGSTPWPERADAEADLGLAYLMTGNESEGLGKLHAAQGSFEAAGDLESLALSLENEAAYFQQAKKPNEEKLVRAKLDQYR